MYGKIIGAMIGGSVGLVLAWSVPAVLLAAIAGAVVGHIAVDREPVQPKALRPPTIEELFADPPPPPRARPRRRVVRPRPAEAPEASPAQRTLAEKLAPIFIEVARADGAVTQPEVRVAREFFQDELRYEGNALEAVRVALKVAIAAPVAELEALTVAARAEVKPSLRLDVVRALYELALVDGELARSEAEALKRVVQHFNLSDAQLQTITAKYFGHGAEAAALLGLTTAASDDEIRAAFKRLAAEAHPDRAPPEELEATAERFREIKDAWDALRRIRGL